MISNCVLNAFRFVLQHFANHEVVVLNQDTCVVNGGIIPPLPLPPSHPDPRATAEIMEKN